MPVKKKPVSKPESSYNKQDLISTMTLSVHGDLKAYREPVQKAIQEEPEFAAHFISYNQRKGSVRDAKLAIPFWSLVSEDYLENALAHLCLQPPRGLLQAYRLALETRPAGRMGALKKLIGRYLKARECFPAWFQATALQHRESLKTLYALTHTKPAGEAQRVLFERDYGNASVFTAVQHLADYPLAAEIGGVIAQHNIPFLVARGALGKRLKEPDVLLAVVDQMSATERVTNAKALQRLGVQDTAALRGALTAGFKRDRKSKVNVLKTSQAAQALAKDNPDDELVAQLEDLQERQLERSIEGNWLVLADKSGSMESAIEVARQVSGFLSRMVKGKVHLMFFDTAARYFDATGKTYEEIKKATQAVRAAGGTSIGAGLIFAFDKKLPFDGIAVISDGGENNEPRFSWVYKAAFDKTTTRPPVYFYQLAGNDFDRFSGSLREGGIDFQTFDLRGKAVDYYSLPGLVETMNVKRYDLVQAIYDCPLLTVEQALRVPRRFKEVMV